MSALSSISSAPSTRTSFEPAAKQVSAWRTRVAAVEWTSLEPTSPVDFEPAVDRRRDEPGPFFVGQGNAVVGDLDGLESESTGLLAIGPDPGEAPGGEDVLQKLAADERVNVEFTINLELLEQVALGIEPRAVPVTNFA